MNIFLKKKILIYGLGKSGLAAFKFLKKNNDVFLYDDSKINFKSFELKKKFINKKDILNLKFDKIVLSPGIDINKCKLSKFLKKNRAKIYSDLDVFYSFFKNDCITITGTNGKSTTCQLLYEVLLAQKFNVKLVGNIGNPILSIKNVSKKTIFVIEASSYQLDYSQIFKSKYALILNISPDHIERHKTIEKYLKAKFKLIKNQKKGHLAFVKKNDELIQKEISSNKFKGRIIGVNTNKHSSFYKNVKNKYFFTETNHENLTFVLKLAKYLKLKKKLLLKTIQNFRGLKYRQQIIFQNKNLTIINDSKSTSFSSTIGVLKSNENILWLLGGIHKKGDKFELPKKYFNNIEAFIFGKDKNFFNSKLKKKIKFKNFKNIKDALNDAFFIVRKKKFINYTILFSPCAASFDSFKNFEERGYYFNNLVRKYLNGKKKFNT